MLDRLYLDTARLGRMSPRAQRAQIDFVRVAGEEGCTLYWERFLQHGFEAWPPHLQQRYAGLADWHGLHELKHSLAALVGTADVRGVLLANQSAQLVRLAARTLFRHSRRVLVTDLTWPSYARILQYERRRARGHITSVPLRRAILHDGVSLDCVVQRIVTVYRQKQCDGLFLPAVSHDGIRLPVRMICRALSQIQPLRFVAVDGAQAFCHAPVDLRNEWCDVYIAGCHKWLGGHIPMGLALLPRATSYLGSPAILVESSVFPCRVVHGRTES